MIFPQVWWDFESLIHEWEFISDNNDRFLNSNWKNLCQLYYTHPFNVSNPSMNLLGFDFLLREKSSVMIDFILSSISLSPMYHVWYGISNLRRLSGIFNNWARLRGVPFHINSLRDRGSIWTISVSIIAVAAIPFASIHSMVDGRPNNSIFLKFIIVNVLNRVYFSRNVKFSPINLDSAPQPLSSCQ